MSRSSPLLRWMPIIVLILLPISTVIVVDAGPATAPMLGFTPTVTATATETATPTETSTATATVTKVTPPPPPCIPVIAKRCEPAVAQPGEEVICTISVTNTGRAAAEHAQVIDHVPDYLEIRGVAVDPEDQGREMIPRIGQQVIVDIGTIGPGFEVTIVIRTQVREDAPRDVCVENLAEFRAYNCPDEGAAVICTGLPETGGSSILWTVAGGLGTVLLVLSLVLAQRHRS
jgi:uncharacterized repeat protein (TIGR01451 family)/LPXTG-motif cell wall-anchored protein